MKLLKLVPNLILLVSAASGLAQQPGDAVTPAALGKLDWIQGEAPSGWEAEKVYLLECWATWCGPCIAAIPHLDALHDKYSAKGLRVMGVNVWEDGRDKVAAFVKGKGEGMSCPVAYTGKGGAFEKEWLVPAGVGGIPHAFLVKNGKVLLHAHPAQLSEELIEDLLAGGEREERIVREATQGRLAKEKASTARRAFQEAREKGDTAVMEKALGDIRASEPEAEMTPLQIDLYLARKDWDGLKKVVEGFTADMEGDLALQNVCDRVVAAEGSPEEFRGFLIGRLDALHARSIQVYSHVIQSRLCWSLGDKEGAKASARQGADAARLVNGQNPGFPSLPFVRFAESVEKGEMPGSREFGEWAREAMAAANATAAGQ